MTDPEPASRPTIIVQREAILASTIRVATRSTFNPTREFKVIFSGEDADDLGGPKREYLRLVLLHWVTWTNLNITCDP
ncbi:MAG: hypothetical protein ABW185_03680 [Sedimenticola sp.]